MNLGIFGVVVHITDDDDYHDGDILVFSDHGLYSPDDVPIYLWSYNFSAMIGDRATANLPDGSVYTLPLATKVICLL